jgi:hypothetical protein
MAPTFSMFVTALATFSLASAKIYFKEDFSDAGWEKRWTASTEWKPKVQQINLSSTFDYHHLL